MAELRRWRFAAWDPAARTQRRGELAADSPAAVRAELAGRGWEPERIDPVAGGVPGWMSGLSRAWRAWQRRSRRLIVADLCESVAALVQVGMPLDQALEQLAASPLRSLPEVQLLRDLAEALRSGTAFSAACALHDGWFDRYDVAVLSAGQHAGELNPVLRAVAEHHQRQGAATHRLVTALAYPAIVAVIGLVVFVFLTQSVLPRIAAILAAARTTTPWLTLQVMSLGNVLMWWWPVILAGVILLWIGGRRLALRVRPEGHLGRLVHGNPWARLRARSRVAITSSALARLLRAGVPLAEALEVTAATVPDRALRALLGAAAAAVEGGRDLSTVMAASALVEPEFAHMLRLGEGSGDLPGMLDRIAARYQEASDRSSERVAAVVGPLAIVVLMVLIGVLVLAVGQALSRVADLV